ncbi:hypothetical protein BM1_06988 [Bipolaris maydis]|uniref:uncharacterized protein n=1 Tax=Cochliobolus heterostrophus TaxID=5016 RepID=UPI0024DD0394|nr:hypothetical protein BM1_06988 [Bipolaris maydis]KAJ5023766.1 hypothetical protein J3E73DRAFT_259965 [Bipolaris maydis]KAJ5058290.1 hypothetical protein J3E74DRAFT_408536 [Bipolaris maydis]KAJ6269027.1 hypothetical protein PSV08DRAFT_249134 [Bipolaris maydis]KAJ6279837.1 hypothetical protein J3E71DRAFT_344484 [Bipolaris maydis]
MSANPRYEGYNNEGSREAQIALSALARTLHMNPLILRIALSNAFDLLETTGGNPTLALHISFNRLNYCIDSNTLDRIIATFRDAVAFMLSDKKASTQTAPIPYYSQVHTPAAPRYRCIAPKVGYNIQGESIGHGAGFNVPTVPSNRGVNLPSSVGEYEAILSQIVQGGHPMDFINKEWK